MSVNDFTFLYYDLIMNSQDLLGIPNVAYWLDE